MARGRWGTREHMTHLPWRSVSGVIRCHTTIRGTSESIGAGPHRPREWVERNATGVLSSNPTRKPDGLLCPKWPWISCEGHKCRQVRAQANNSGRTAGGKKRGLDPKTQPSNCHGRNSLWKAPLHTSNLGRGSNFARLPFASILCRPTVT